VAAENHHRAERPPLAPLLLAAQGAILGIGTASGLAALSGQGPVGAMAATMGTMDVFIDYGFVSVLLAAFVLIGLALLDRRRRLPNALASLGEHRLAVPLAAFIAGSGTGLCVGSFVFVSKTSWSFGSSPPEVCLIVVLLPGVVLLPLAIFTAAFGATSNVSMASSLLALTFGYGLGHEFAGAVEERIFHVEPHSVAWWWVCGLAVVAGSAAADCRRRASA
jgi:hypothetical protein